MPDKDWGRKRVAGMMRGSDGLPVAFHDLDADHFPFLIQLHDEVSGDLVFEQTVHGPGAVKIPGYPDRPISSTVTVLRTGRVVVTKSDGATHVYDTPE